MEDRRSEPRPRKHAELWQCYLWWDELVESRKRHTLRVDAIEKGKSNMSLDLELEIVETMDYDGQIARAKARMIEEGARLGEVWEWMTSIKGLKAGSLAAQVLAQVDDIARFDMVSKLWRFAGYAVFNGKAEHRERGQKAHFNKRLKSTCWLVGDQFMRQQTPLYIDFYVEKRVEEDRKHPVPLCNACDGMAIRVGKKWKCGECGNPATSYGLRYTPSRLKRRAMRKMEKMWLQHLWETWRKAEGLPVPGPYVEEVLGHTRIIRAGDG